MLRSVEIISTAAPGSSQGRLPENSLNDLLANRVLIEAEFARLGHTFRHGRLYRDFERFVTRPVLKSDAENVVKRVEGVTNVINNIEVLPPSPMDDQIRRAEFRAIYGDPSIGTKYGYQALPSIHIIVKNGHVTLEGVVDNEFDKNLINVRANGVPNVFSVTNNLRVVNSRAK